MKSRATMIWLAALLIVMSVNALPEDAQVEIRDASTFSTNVPEAYFVNQNPDPAEPGRYVEVRIKVENVGIESARDMIVEILPEYPFSLDPGDDGKVRIGDTHAKQIGEDAYVIYWRLRVDKDALDGNSNIRLRYSTNDGRQWISLEDWYIRVQTHNAIINIAEATTDPAIIKPGEEFKLHITLENMAHTLLKDVTTQVSLIYGSATSIIELPFTPLGGSNELTTKHIDPGVTKKITFSLIADVDAATGIYKIPIEIGYSDSSARNYTKRTLIGARVGTEPKLFVATDRPTRGEAGQEIPMILRLVNRGKEDINFLFVTIEGTEDLEILSPRQVYIGNVDSDDFETEEFTVKAAECGVVYQVPLTVEYESASNEKFEDQMTLEYIACTGNGKQGPSAGVVIMIILVVIVAIVIIIYKVKRKKD